MKALGQAGLDFIANKYKELKKLIGDKPDRSEIITKEERNQLDIAKKQLVAMEIGDLESKLKSSSDYVLRYPNVTHIKMFNFVNEVKSGKIKPPEGIETPYTYSMQKYFLDSTSFKSYAICDSQMQTLSLEQISAMKKNDGSICLVRQSILDALDAYFSASRALVTTAGYFVKKEDGKGLSTNDFDNTAKAMIDGIPNNPKYTDTVTEVVDNLTTSDSTKALSAKQGRTLQDNKADKSNISRCKTKGYNTSNTWQSLSTERDLEDWIGDFDKRTRELKSGGGVQYGTETRYNQYLTRTDTEWMFLKIGNYVIASYAGMDRGSDFVYNTNIPAEFRPKKNIPFSIIYPEGDAFVKANFMLRTDGTMGSERPDNNYCISTLTLIYECA